jgi:hypothetical protein
MIKVEQNEIIKGNIMKSEKSHRNHVLNIGIFIRSMPGVNPEVRAQCISFVQWLRKKIPFSIRVLVLLKKEESVITELTNKPVSATFWGPNNKNELPYIKVATGDYQQLIAECGKFNALKAILGSIGHEVVHYQQWIEDRKASENEAKKKGRELVCEFIDYEFDKLLDRLKSLITNPTEESFSRLMVVYDQGSSEIKIHVIQCLTNFTKLNQAKRFLIQLTTDYDWEVRSEAIDVLSYFDKESDISKIIIDCLKDSNEDVRISAVKALKYIGDKNAINPLIDALEDDKELVRGYAAESIGVLGDYTSIEILRKKLQNEHRNAAKLRFYVGLYYLGEKQYFEFILKQLKSRSYLVRMATACYLANLANEDNTAIILDHLQKCLAVESRQEVIDAIKATLNKLGKNI